MVRKDEERHLNRCANAECAAMEDMHRYKRLFRFSLIVSLVTIVYLFIITILVIYASCFKSNIDVTKETRPNSSSAPPAVQMLYDDEQSTSNVLYWKTNTSETIATFQYGVDIVHSPEVGTYCVIPSDGKYVIYSSLQFRAGKRDNTCCQIHAIMLWKPEQAVKKKMLSMNRFVLRSAFRSHIGPVTVELKTGDRMLVTITEFDGVVTDSDYNYFGLYKLSF